MNEPPTTPTPGPRYLFDDGRRVRRLLRTFLLLCALLLAADLVIDRHAEHGLDGMFGFFALFGFAAYAVLVVLSEGLRLIVKRRPDYYDD